MTQKMWDELRFPGEDETAWELFHENSKTSAYTPNLSDAEALEWMEQTWESLPFAGYPAVELPGSLTPMKLSLEEAVTRRVTTASMSPCELTMESLRTILYYGYGLTRDNNETNFIRPFRVLPSAGAMYPLEIFLYSAQVQSLSPGIYHYNPMKNNLRLLREGNQASLIADALVQKNIAREASLMLFITAMFERSTVKYGERGYRFVLLEAGHVAQNINLAATGLELGCINIGGFFDRRVDEILGLDGLTHSTIYLTGIGGRNSP